MKRSFLHISKIVSVLAFTMLLLQCKKDTPPKPATELILGTWAITAVTYSPGYDLFGNGTPITDAFPYYQPCEKDNVTTFKTNSEGEFNEGATKCNSTDPQSTAFLWTMKTNNTILNISALADFTIVMLDGKTMKLSSTFTEVGVTYTETITFVKK